LLATVQDIKNALFLTDPCVEREKLINKKGQRVAGTCEWIIQHPSYQSWLQNGDQLLWISGGPGKGKTMMSIFLTEELERVASTSIRVQTICYFCSVQDGKLNTAVAILRSLIHQIITQTPDLAKHAQAYFTSGGLQRQDDGKRQGGRQPQDDGQQQDDRQRQTLSSFETLWIILKSIVTDEMLPTTFCVLDGLDESDEQALELLVPRLIELTSKEPSSTSSSAFRLAIVSRDIRSLNGCTRIKLDPDHDDDVAHDIKSFVSVMTEGLPAPAGGEIAFRRHLRETMLERANGTFLWIGFAMHELRKRRTSTEILAALEDLPSGLGNIYGAMLLQIPSDHREMSSKILMWVTMALRPLALEELVAATNIRSSSSIITQDQAIRDAVHLCAPLLQIRNEKRVHDDDNESCSSRGMPSTEKVHLIHASARDYLVRKERDNNPILEMFRIKMEEAHLNIARTGLRCIASSGLQHKRIRMYGNIDPEESSLLRYSILHWYEHVKLCPTVAIELFRTFEGFFQRQSKIRDNWYLSEKRYRYWVPPQLHMASEYGVISWIEWTLQQPSRVPTFRSRKNERNSDGATALHVAIYHGQEEAARRLIDEGIDLLAKNQDGHSALSYAIRFKKKLFVLLLAKNGAATNGRKIPQFPDGIGTNINRKDGNRLTLLHYMALGGLESETRMLVQNGAHVEAKGKASATPLHYAARGGYEAVVGILIASGAKIDAKKDGGETVLHEAVWSGSKEIVRTVLHHGANIEAKTNQGQTALYHATRWGSGEVVRILLDHGANSEAKNGRGHTALHHSAYSGYEEVVRILLEHGADIEAKNDMGDTALHLAAYWGKEEGVRILLHHGAHIEAKTNEGKTARDLAVERENELVVHLIDQTLQAFSDAHAI
jgi:ankyrin repeat protein